MPNVYVLIELPNNEGLRVEEYLPETYKRIRGKLLKQHEDGDIKVARVIVGKELVGGIEYQF